MDVEKTNKFFFLLKFQLFHARGELGLLGELNGHPYLS